MLHFKGVQSLIIMYYTFFLIIDLKLSVHSVINNLLQERPGIGFAMALVNTSALQEIHLSVRYVILKCALHLKNVEN